ncbi:MAG: FecR domain-containing protein [Actinomycetota bacterium]
MARVNGEREKRIQRYLRLFTDAGIGRRGRRAEDAARMAATLEALEPDSLEQDPASVARTHDALMQAHIRMRVEGRKRARVAVPVWLSTRKVAFAGVAVALLAIAVVLALTLTGGRGEEVALLRIYRGVVRVYPGGGEEPSTVTDEMRIRVNDRIETGGDGLAEIDLDNGGVARLDGASALSIEGHGEDGATMRQLRGNVFSNAGGLAAYTLTSGEVTVNGGGAVFNTDASEGSVRTRVLDGDTRIANRGVTKTVGGGEEALAGEVAGEPIVTVSEIDPRVYSEPWYVWNLTLDRSGTRPGGPTSTSPAGDTIDLPPPVSSDAGVPDGASTPSTTPTGTTPSSTQVPSTTADTNESLTVVLSATAIPDYVRLRWSVSGSGSYNSVSILKTQSNTSPVDPTNRHALVAAAAAAYTDGEVDQGERYTYRVCLLKGGNVLAYSNVVSVQIPLESSTNNSRGPTTR